MSVQVTLSMHLKCTSSSPLDDLKHILKNIMFGKSLKSSEACYTPRNDSSKILHATTINFQHFGQTSAPEQHVRTAS